MSLQVWLPLNGDLHNQGLKKYNLSMFRGSEIYNNNGKIGKCFYANGVNTIKILNIISDFYNYTEYSLCAWFYIEARNTSHTGCGIISGGNWNSQVLNLGLSDWSTDHYTRLRISGTSWARTYTYNFALNTWYHVVVSSDNSKTYAYVNGELIGDSQASFLPTSIEGNDICIGGATYYAGMQFFGRINDVRIYDHCLSAKEVKKLSQGLILHYKLNDYPTLCKTDLMTWTKESGVTSTLQSDGSVKIDCTAKTSSRWGIYCDIQNCLPNTTYTFQIECKVANSSKPFQLSVGCNPVPSGTSQFGINRKTMNNTNDFVIYTASVTTNADTTWIRFYLATTCSTTNTDQQYAFVKNVNMTLGPVNTIIYDTSGYDNNGHFINNTTISNTPKYNTCTSLIGEKVDSSSNTLVGAQYLYGILPLTTPLALTVAWWAKINAYGRGGIFETTSSTDIPFGSDYTTTAIANWDTTFRIFNGSSNINFFNNFSRDDVWHFRTIIFNGANAYYYEDGVLKQSGALSGTLPTITGFRMGLGRAGGVYRQIKQQVSDLRVYAIALSADDVLELYKTSKIVNGTTATARDLE